MPAGRPPKYKTPEEMQKVIDDYFENVPTRPVLVGDELRNLPAITITGLCLHLGFCDRASFYDYEKNKEFSHTIKKARLRIENDYEMSLRTGRNNSGDIFALKNFGWKDKQEVEQSGVTVVKIKGEF